MFRLTASALLTVLLGSTEGRAETLTCAMFKDRLAEAFNAQLKGAAALRYADAEGNGSFTRYSWTGAPDLGGKLTCGRDDAFADFYMTVAPEVRASSAAPSDTTRFDALAAASVCALSDGSPAACKAMATTMTGDGIDQYEEDLAKHDERPQSLQDYDFAKDLDAVFYVTPTTFSWAIGPGVYTTVEAARPPLVPQDRDKDD